ncbi:unnamed protein product [Clonostachys byssicola]|uniref:Uncharacterized protein n=1 Tax=Clonostachys byssicola TaxID=160290 RepID=A0A9N9Y455_9HYPO|nr:unnamed protein product [Clonostachys byssicola]
MDASALPPLPLLFMLMLTSGGDLGSKCLEDLLPSRNSTRGLVPDMDPAGNKRPVYGGSVADPSPKA